MEALALSGIRIYDNVARVDPVPALDAQISAQLSGCFVGKDELARAIGDRIVTVSADEFDPGKASAGTYYFVTGEFPA